MSQELSGPRFLDDFRDRTGATGLRAESYTPPDWSDLSDHMGPTEPTPLKEGLGRLHTSGLMLLMAHAVTWFQEYAGWRAPETDTGHLIEAIYAYACNPALVTVPEDLKFFPLDEGPTPQMDAARGFRWIFGRLYHHNKGARPLFPPVTPTAQAVCLARQFFEGRSADFDRAFELALANVRSVAHFPDPLLTDLPAGASEEDRRQEALRSFGPVVPPATTVLLDGDPLDQAARALRAMDRGGNPFLREIGEAKAMGLQPRLADALG